MPRTHANVHRHTHGEIVECGDYVVLPLQAWGGGVGRGKDRGRNVRIEAFLIVKNSVNC